jgi:type 2 lantibiotic biosynthesis protein LanM
LDLLGSGIWLADEVATTLAKALLSRFDRFRPKRARAFPYLFDTSDVYRDFVFGHETTADVPLAQADALRLAQQFATQTVLLLKRVRSDCELLTDRLEIASPAETLREIRCGLSDRHNGGSTVCSLRFSDGRRIIYKPRPVRCEEFFYRALSVLHRTSRIRFACRLLTILDRGEYGWCEEVNTESRVSAAAAARFYYRAGVLCACANQLALTDCHDGNLLASGEQPYLIDCETLGHPEPADRLRQVDTVEEAFHRGVTRTGFLPFWKTTIAGEATLHAAGLANSRLIAWHSLRLDWHCLGTDGMYAVPSSSYSKLSGNLPQGNEGGVHLPNAYIQEIDGGFRDASAAARETREELLSLATEMLRETESRFIFRDTDVYYAVTAEATVAADYAASDAFAHHLEVLRAKRDWPPEYMRLIEVEIACLRRGDIPRFTVPMTQASHARESGHDTTFRFAQAPLDVVLTRIGRNSPMLDERESSTVRRTLQLLDVEAPKGRVEDVASCANASQTANLLSRACEVGDLLMATAIHDGPHIGWLAPVRVGGTLKYRYEPVPDGLYEGKLGIALFLAWLFRRSERYEFLECVHHTLASTPSVADAFNLNTPSSGIGVSADWQVLFSLAAFSRLLDEPRYAQSAAKILSLSSEVCPTDDPGMLGGLAGEILARLALADATGNEFFIDHARRIARRSAPEKWSAPTVRTGLAHGEAGLGLALFKLWQATGDTKNRDQAERYCVRERAAWAERSPAATELVFSDRIATELSWCSGRVGMLLLCQRLGVGGLDPDIRAAATQRISGNDSLCCGSLGHAGVLHLLGQAATGCAESPLVDLCGRTTRQWALLAGSCEVQPPGLFSGLSGVGISCLVAASDDPELSLLTLEILSN